MSVWEAFVLFAVGSVAAFVNSMAGGGSLVTIPLLAITGLGGLMANGTNRVAILLQNMSTVYSFSRRGVDVWRKALPIVAPAVVGGVIGAYLISNLDDEVFKKVFGLVMIPMLVLSVRNPKTEKERKPWPMGATVVVFFAIGIYAGAIQAGVGFMLLAVLTRSGYSLVEANALKMFIVMCVTAFVVPIFIYKGHVAWAPAAVLAAGMMIGGFVGAKTAVEGGDRVIKPVLFVAVVGLAGSMLGFY